MPQVVADLNTKEWLIWKIKNTLKTLSKFLLGLGFQKASNALRDCILSEEENARQFFLDVVIKGAATLKRCLKMDEESFLRVHGCAHRDARTYYCYGIVDEVWKAGTAALQWDEFLGGPEPKREADSLTNNIIRVVNERIRAEQELWIRKLTEHLINLILLSVNNRDEIFRALIAAQSLDDHLGLDKDFQDFFSCRNENNRYSIEWYAKIIEDVQIKESAECLPLFAKKIDRKKLPMPGRILLSTRERFKMALQYASSEEKIVLKFSYSSGFSESSRAIHATIQDRPVNKSGTQEVDGHFLEMGMLSAHVLHRIHSICSIEPTGLVKKFIDTIRSPESFASKFSQNMEKEFAPGDFVLVGGDLAEVIKTNKSQFGYTSARIRYLDRPPLPEITEDEFPARYISLLASSENIRDFMLAQFNNMPADIKDLFKDRVSKASDAELLGTVREALVKMSRAGMMKLLFKQKKLKERK